MSQETINQVMAASQAWIAKFNQHDLEGCLEGYLTDASMKVAPVGEFVGAGAIALFWRDFARHHPAELKYSNVDIKVIDDRNAVLAADWSMNIASGFISKELWVKQDSGEWKLAQDDFSVLALSISRD
ncbi:hypothetical protein BTA51_13595 [Hahella sp. CCB-MM4]|uniref:YybH family protein n=1 Tax=Hahella sp. (strain CCB-MM4) TaxID=1926491 RepID=UPI000B9C5AAB|nr:nuclear transport factor 2 family protein [Hahella sp. CCB-MM4]OZG72984.1 hypothetical protein BTA51_13595 [Hahella sp. CCB-MM4]